MVPDVSIIKNSAATTAHNAKVFAASPADQISRSVSGPFPRLLAESGGLIFFFGAVG